MAKLLLTVPQDADGMVTISRQTARSMGDRINTMIDTAPVRQFCQNLQDFSESSRS